MQLKQKEGLSITGRVCLTATDPGTGQVMAVVETNNLVVTVGKELIARMLVDETGYDTGLTYCAEGTGITAPAIGQTTLVTEAARKALTSKSRASNVITLSTFFTAAEANDFIKEVGIFGHSTASATPDSGVMFARALLSYDNSGATYDLTFDWVITLG